MPEIPRRMTLSGQSAEAIRKGIDEKAWTEFLPGERRLSELFQVSRPTIRTALRLLAKDGWIEIKHGRRNRIIHRPRAPLAHKSAVAIITQDPAALYTVDAAQSVADLRMHLAEHGFATEIFVCRARGVSAQRRKIEAFLRQNRVVCCLLLWVGPELQQWFASHSVPALVLGSCHASVRLPSLDIDLRAVCRHAAGVLLGRGHRRMALILPEGMRPGSVASEQGFLEAVQARPDPDDIRASVVRHNGTARHLAGKLDALFDSPQFPTALVVAHQQHVFNVLIYLLRRGLAVPEAVSLIARDRHDYFTATNPPISHYFFKAQTFNQRLTRLMLQMVNEGHLAPKPHLISPQFYLGGTIQ